MLGKSYYYFLACIIPTYPCQFDQIVKDQEQKFDQGDPYSFWNCSFLQLRTNVGSSFQNSLLVSCDNFSMKLVLNLCIYSIIFILRVCLDKGE
jgi:hypothetical protein